MSGDVRESEYAVFLEDVIRLIMEKKPQVIGVVFFDPEGNQYSNYYGDPCPSEKALMGYRFTADATFDEVMANARMIVEEAEEEEEI
jgi:hypothetical protein